MAKHSPQPPAADCSLAPRALLLRVTSGSDAIAPFTPNGFALATKLLFMLPEHVAFPKQNRRVPARATGILAQRGEALTCVEPGNPANGDSRSLDS